MIGLMILLFFAVYIAVTTWVTRATASWAKRNNRSSWGWGGLAVFVMYNLVFWDFIPTLAAHKYYCATEAGFWVHKTPEQWRQENPGVMEKLPEPSSTGSPLKYEPFDDRHGKRDIYLLNERFNWIVTQQDISDSLPIIRTEQVVMDVKKNEVLARYVDFGTGNSVKNSVGPPGPLKFWLHSGNCSGGGTNQDRLRNFRDNFYGSKK